MEERSPGSYRFSIRGSSLRSPFGIRNVKVYWNGLPLTDGGGNTYLNLLDFNSIGSMEIVKGPGGSLYGAGTGGVVLIRNPDVKKNNFEVSALAGSYGLRRVATTGQFKTKNVVGRIQYAHQDYDGYRQQSAMRRDAINTDFTFLLNSKSTLAATFFYTDLYYQTPGALTKIQYDTAATMARPTIGQSKGSVDRKAAVSNKTPYGGLVYDYDWNENWTTRVGIFAAYSKFDNPTIRNYEQRRETNTGARTETQFKFGNESTKGKLTFGAEYQHLKSPIGVYGNRAGIKDTVQTFDDLTSTLFVGFAQTEFEFRNGFFITAGASLNYLSYHFNRIEPVVLSQERKFSGIFSPRIAVLKKVNNHFSIFGNVSRGFSPPSLAEVRPSTNTFSDTLKAELGTNYEVGFRGDVFRELSFDVALYNFQLDETIVIRHNNDGAEYFVNGGKTQQTGVEAKLTWHPVDDRLQFVSDLKVWNSYTWNHYRFKNYTPDGVDLSGKKLTGVPPTVMAAGFDMTMKEALTFNVTASYVDHIPLNDANTFFASEYILLGARIGWKTDLHGKTLNVFGGVDNFLNQKYSLGNDLNAVANRFYNVAPARNFYAGLTFSFN
jgi:iron complex outermembrane receptor protein